MPWTDATLPNGMHMRLPAGAFEAEMPYAAGVAGADPTAFAAATAAFSTNPALAMAAREQARMKSVAAQRISTFEGLALETTRRVASAMFDLQVRKRLCRRCPSGGLYSPFFAAFAACVTRSRDRATGIVFGARPTCSSSSAARCS
jgi:hypothetical protein